MKIRDDLEIDDDRLAEICERYHITELSLFGSVLRDDFGPESDIDVLYLGEPERSDKPWALAALALELESVFGRTVDLVWRDGVHWYIRDRVLSEAKTVHAS